MSLVCEVRLWRRLIGALSYPSQQGTSPKVAAFEYAPDFQSSGIEISPLHMPLGAGVFRFPDISERTFHGLPGLLADSLPDKFGNQLIDIYLASQGISASSITPLDRLLYVGTRSMGALEFEPAHRIDHDLGGALDLSRLTELANLSLHNRDQLDRRLQTTANRQEALSLIRVGTSAGGARAKAIIALGPKDEVRAGDRDHGPDFSHWLLKFDGITGNKDRDQEDPPGSTVVEYIYSLLAKECGIEIPRTRLLENGNERHFLIERFDRIRRDDKPEKIDKLHYSSWCGLDHAHRDTTGSYSYEQLVQVMRKLKLPQTQVAELYRRAVFNVVGRNQDDHTKNFGFLMNREGEWWLSPAFDMTYAFDPQGKWTRTHQITLNGKGENFTREDLLAFGQICNLSSREASLVVEKTCDVFAGFSKLAEEYEVPRSFRETIESQLRLNP